jgi:hypothetical protein
VTIFYCLRFEYSPKLEGQFPVFIFPRNRVAQLYPQALVRVRVTLRLTVSLSVLVSS